MHQLFRLVLGQRDLSRAGDLFSLDNSEIEDCLSQVLDEIRSISRSPDYLTNDNDQAVVEICITRITTAIRETGSIEKHGAALVALWESCLEHNLQPQGKDEDTPHEDTPHEDTPHAKIASDITSCILQNYSRVPVMTLAVPVAMRFLQHSNRELCRNMSSYLSLTAIANAELLIQHTEAIALSVLGGNSMLLRVLPSMYPLQPEPIHRHIRGLVAMVTEMKPSSRQHLLRLLQMISEQNPLTLSPLVPFLIGHLSDDTLNDALLAVLVGVAQASPASLRPFLPALRSVGQQSPGLLGYVAKIHGAVGLTSETEARDALLYLVSLLSCMEHSIHHTLLLEIHSLTNHYPSLLGGGARDIYRMSNSFSAMARLLSHRLEGDAAAAYRGANDSVVSRRCEDQSGPGDDDGDDEGQHLQVKIQAFDEEAGGGDTSPGPQRHQSLGQASRAEHREMRFSRSKSLAIHAARSHCTNPDGEGVELHPEVSLNCSASSPVGGVVSPPVQENHSDSTERPPSSTTASQGDAGPLEVTEPQEGDRLWKHLRDNMEKIRAFCLEMIKQIPIPEKCTIEARQRGCVAKLSFSCPLKGHYCLYGKSCFSVCSPQPHLWIRVMLLTLQSKSSAALSGEDVCVQQLRTLWEQTQLKGGDSFERAMTQTASPDKKDLARLQVHLEEVRFFDLFGYSEEEGGWLCFMCNNPEKATVVNQDGQPLIEGKLKEKQVRWKFLKRWKTRYFTLAGNQLLFRKAKSDKLDDNGIELIKVQSVKAVARKRRQCGLPRAFEIFTDTKTYVLKACDEDHAEEWLRCITVAVARAKECENREATTYL